MSRWRRLRFSAAGLAAAAGWFLPASAFAAAGPPAFTPAGSPASLSASGLQVRGFAFAGQTTVAGQSVLEFTATSGTLTSLALVEPCRQSGPVQIVSAQEAAQAALPDGFTLWVTDLSYTDSGGAHSWTVAAAPAVGSLEPDGTTVTAVSATLLASSVPGLGLTGFRLFAAICDATAGSPAAPTGTSAPTSNPPSPTPSAAPSAPAALPTPSPTSVLPSPSATPAPAPSSTPNYGGPGSTPTPSPPFTP